MSVRQRVGVYLLVSAGVLTVLGRLPVTAPELDPVRTDATAHRAVDTQPVAPDGPRTTRPVVVGTPRLARGVDPRRSSADAIPYPALRAYLRAAQVLADARPQCRLGWPLLAAIGRVETDHGRAGDARLHPDGVSMPALIGPPLDGRGGLAPVPDSDGGRLDGDRTWDRAVGPMQIVPGSWTLIGVDGDGDGVRSPSDIDDAALAVGVHLCSAGFALDTRAGMRHAVHRYNAAPSYAGLVLFYERLYQATQDAAEATISPAPLAVPVVRQAQARTARLARHPEAVARASNTHPVLKSAHPQPRPAETTALPSDAAEPTTGAAGSSTVGSAGETAPGDPTPTADPAPDPTATPDPTPDPTATPDPTPDPTPTPDATPDPTASTSEASACTVDGTAPPDPTQETPDPAATTDPCPVPSSSPSDPAGTATSTTATAGDGQALSPSSPGAS